MITLPRLRRRSATVLASVVVLAAASGMTAVNATAAAGGSISIPGSVSSSSQVVGITTQCTPTPTTPGHYTEVQFKLTSGAGSTINASITPNGFTGVLSLYQGGFFPDQPVTNCFAASVGSGPGATVNLSSPAPDVTSFGQTSSLWTLVVSGAGADQVGSYTGSISSTDTGIQNGWTDPVIDTTPPVLSVPSGVTAEATSSSGAVVTYSASANDAVDGPVAATCTPASGSRFPIGTTSVTCTAQDSAGNKATKAFAVTVRDTTAPTITGSPAANTYTLQATGPSGATLSSLGLGVTDAVDPSPTLTCSPTLPQTFAIGSHPNAVSCTARDATGNTRTAVYAVTVVDSTAPTVTVPADITTEATGPNGAVVTYPASAFDAVDGPVATTCTPAPGSTFAIGSTSVTCRAVDHAGNSGSASFTVTVRDTTAPTVTVPQDLSVEATSAQGAVVDFSATATDTVDGSLPVTCTPASGATFALGSTTVSCSATDSHGNTGKATFAVVVGDSTAPVLSLPGSLIREATGPNGAAVTYTATATDAVDGAVPLTCSATHIGTVTSGTTFPLGGAIVDCVATDAHGNRATGSFTVLVRDTTAPVVTVPQHVTVEATGPSGAVATFAASATDAVDGTFTPECTSTSGQTFPIGDTTVVCTATDAHGNTGSASFTVTVADTTAPALTVPADFSVEATGPQGAEVSYTVTATDLVDGAVGPSCTVPSGTVLALGAHTITCVATDQHGNAVQKSFTATVVDTTGPTVTVPADFAVEATGADGAPVTFSTSATDLVDGSVPVTCSEGRQTVSSGDTLALGAHAITCGATDAQGNGGTASFTVTVQDTTPPTLTVPADFTVEATGPTGAVVTFTTSATDLVDGPVPTSCSADSGDTLAVGSHVIQCTAIDAHDNLGTKSFTVTVQDSTAPVVTVSADITAEATGPDGAPVSFTSSATDTVDGTLPTTCTVDGAAVSSGDTFALGTTTVTCTATDSAGNVGKASFIVTVQDTTSPVLTVHDVTAEATGPDGAPVEFSATATDAVTTDPAVTCTAGGAAVSSGDTFPLGDTTVTCTATDAAGNAGTATFTVSVVDTTGPVLTVPAKTLVVEATSPAGAHVTFTAIAHDAVRGDVPVTCTPASGALFPVGSTTVTCTATDAPLATFRAFAARAALAAVNTSQASFTVVVKPYVDHGTGGGNTGGGNTGGGNTGGGNSGTGSGTGSASGGGTAMTGADLGGLLGIAALLLLVGAAVTRTGLRRRG